MSFLPLVFCCLHPLALSLILSHDYHPHPYVHHFPPTLPARRKKSLHTWLAMVCEGLDEEEPPTPEYPHWDALRLICAAKICEEMRAAVLQRTGFKCSAGIAHNKVQCGVAQV